MAIRSELEWNGDAVVSELEKVAETALKAAAEEIRTSVVRTMPGKGASKTGTGKNAKFTPSFPGQPPGIREGGRGGLIGSINNEKAGRLKREVGTNLKYAPFLEFGTSRMAARPFMGLGLRRGEQKARKTFRMIMRKALRG